MNVLSVDPSAPEAAPIRRAAEILRGGGLVAFPTETVYGLGASALDPAAVARIYAAKGRPGYNPLIVHAADADAARALAADWPEAAARLAERFWPGPLTLVVTRRGDIPEAVSAGLPTVAVRVPAHPVAHALLLAAGIPVAAPSANRSTEVSPTTAAHVARSLGDRVDLILDGGACPVGIESTVVSVAGGVPTLLRPGTISLDDLRAVVGDVALATAAPGSTAARPSPGMLDRHYAPRAELRIFERGVVPAAREGRWAVLTWTGRDLPLGDAVRMPADAAGYAARLYGTLHEVDAGGYAGVWVEAVPEGPEWAGVRDRLRRAAHPAPGVPEGPARR